ncbi:flagellar brake protein [Aureibacillus halotolerans]|uniref:C-di-GMP-binding flagellar brake protein YcgR n=1 Tax=Aureibacillus halotolerans TaxID=1508390 RepID=A0A4R6U9N7_9BACI|nr:PilZ domain-containing protein [Aureibacillus halotolerans]TDQ41549.1 c-di-GMP-binding flagellar brake protein YcgR [Aureibacillus halotolerans]
MELGTKVRFFLNDVTRREYNASIVDGDENVVWIAMDEEMVKHSSEKEVAFTFSFINNEGTMYTFRGHAINHRKEGNVWMAAFLKPQHQDLHKIQRRHFLRSEVSLSAAIYPCRQQFAPFVTSTHDLSGGGAAIWLPNKKELEADELITLYLLVPEKNQRPTIIKTTYRPIREVIQEDKRRQWAGEFMEIHEEDRKRLIRFCMQRQLQEARV